MDHLAKTKKGLEEINDLVLRGFHISIPPIKSILSAIEKSHDLAERDFPSATAIDNAVIEFEKSGMVENARQTKLLCYGLTSCVFRGGSIMEHGTSFQTLIEAVDALKARPAQYKRCYFGLMAGYFNYNRASYAGDGRDCWVKLRKYLRDNTLILEGLDRKPGWVTHLLANQEVLGDDPGSYYGRQMLESGHDGFDGLIHGLNIQQSSWLITDTVLGQIETATTYGDQRFKSLINMMLELLTEHQMVLEQGLAKLLIRYGQSADLSAHTVLRDFSVKEWGNPWLISNTTRWRLVDDHAREMVSGWLKLDIIREFFDLLSQDGKGDRRRFKFWARYVEQMNDMYFVLGRNAREDQRIDFKAMRDRMAGRLLDLVGSGSDDNAFVMMIDKYAIVEFGNTGNATFIFEKHKLPFQLNGAVSRDGIRRPDCRMRLTHVNSDWEMRFSFRLYSELRIREDIYAKPVSHPLEVQKRVAEADTGSHAKSLSDASHKPLSGSGDRAQEHGPASNVFSKPDDARGAGGNGQIQTGNLLFDKLHGLIEYCKERSFKIEDYRNKGGRLWVITGNASPAVNERLQALGCAYAERRSSWYYLG